MEVGEIRRENLRNLMAKHTAVSLASMLGYRQSSFLSQMAGPNPTREVSEKTVRGFEKTLGLVVGAMDIPIDELVEKPPISSEKLIELLINATRVVGRVCEAEAVNVSIGKLADIVILTFEDAIEHGGVLREDRIKQMVGLLK